jgi:S-adenosylmethionine:tRNA ribosyltransferase-isomerase
MIAPARAPRGGPREGRFVRVDARSHSVVLRPRSALAGELRRGDLLVVNDAATLPASLPARTARGDRLELRLAGPGDDAGRWPAVAFGPGSWRTRTEHRPPPPPLDAGDRLTFEGGLAARVVSVAAASPRLLALAFDNGRDADLLPRLYRAGRPVQYSHLAAELALWDVQTPFAGRPWAVEAPSAGFALDTRALLELRRRGVVIARVTHAAGLSSTGDARLDRLLPLPERFEVPASTVRAAARARRRRGRVIAAGTTVVRALEGNAALHGGCLRAACGTTDLRVGAGTRLEVVDGVWSGLHEPGTSHFELLTAFAAPALLARALAAAGAAGLLGEEFGDGMLVLGYPPVNPAAWARGVRRRRDAAASSTSQRSRPGAGRTRAAGGSASSGRPGSNSSEAATASALFAPLTTKNTRRAAESTGSVSVSRRGESSGPPSTGTTARSWMASAGEPGNSDAV